MEMARARTPSGPSPVDQPRVYLPLPPASTRFCSGQPLGRFPFLFSGFFFVFSLGGAFSCPTKSCENSARRRDTWFPRQQIWGSHRCRLSCRNWKKLARSGRRRCNGHQPERKAGADEKRTAPRPLTRVLWTNRCERCEHWARREARVGT